MMDGATYPDSSPIPNHPAARTRVTRSICTCRMGDIDFKAASHDGFDVDWPVSNQEIAAHLQPRGKDDRRRESVQNRPSNPDGEYLPPRSCAASITSCERGAKRSARPACRTASPN